MKTVSIVLILAIAGPAFAETPASPDKPVPAPAEAGKPFIYDGPDLKSFSAPTPVTIEGKVVAPAPGASPRIELRPTMPVSKPVPEQPRRSLG